MEGTNMTTNEKVLAFATKAHEGQMRKSTGTPMIQHPIRVAKTLEEAGFAPEVVYAGFLHDVAEDTIYTLEDIAQEFGQKVADIVAGNTEDKTKSWEERKQHTIDWIKEAPLEIKALIVADKLDNLRSLVEDYQTVGDELWTHFKRGKEKQKWYFTSVAENATIGLEQSKIPAFFHVYSALVQSFFGE